MRVLRTRNINATQTLLVLNVNVFTSNKGWMRMVEAVGYVRRCKRKQEQTCSEKISRALCPSVNIVAAMKIALETLDVNNSMAYDMHAPPKSWPTRITCMIIQR